MPKASFCPHCGAATVAFAESGVRCTGCDREIYAHSHPTAGVFIQDDDQVLLVKRGAEPAKGSWDVPGGFLEDGELPEDGARREIAEELGLELGFLKLVLADINQLPDRAVLDIMFEAAMPDADPKPGSDVDDFAWFPIDELPENLAFESTRRILERWRAIRTRADFTLLATAENQLDIEEASSVASFSAPLERLPDGWRVECGDWSIHDDLVCGKVDGESAAVLWCDQPIDGDHMIAFVAYTVPPNRNDINCFWEGAGRILNDDDGDEGDDDNDIACTIAGFGGWWDGLTGIERYPEPGLRSTARLEPLVPGRPYGIIAGRTGKTDFLFVDGQLAMQVDDPNASRRASSRVALATWNSHVHFIRASAHRIGS